MQTGCLHYKDLDPRFRGDDILMWLVGEDQPRVGEGPGVRGILRGQNMVFAQFFERPANLQARRKPPPYPPGAFRFAFVWYNTYPVP